MKTNATVYHDIRTGNRIFLCIAVPSAMEEAAKLAYSVEEEITPDQCAPAGIGAIVRKMEARSGLKLELSAILREELGF